MRANEFIVKEDPGDWMQNQVIGRKQIDQRKAREQNIPKVAKLVQQQLEAKIYQLFAKNQKSPVGNIEGAIAKIIIDVMSKSTDTDVTKNNEVFGNAVTTLINTIMNDLDNFKDSPQILTQLEDILTKSFKIKNHSSIDNEVASKIAKLLANGASPEEIAKELAKDSKIGNEEAKEIVDKVSQASSEPSELNDTYLEKFIDNVKEHLFRKQHNIDLRDPESVADFIEYNVKKHRTELEIDSPEQIDKIIDDLINDPDMAFNFKPQENFRGLVYSDGGLKFKQGDIDGKNIAFVQDENDNWAVWEMMSTTSWRLKEKVVDISKLRSLESLKGEMVPKAFRQEKTGGQSNLYRVSNR